MPIVFGILLFAAGVYHFVNPAFYDPFMPDWFPKPLANAASGIAELIIGAMLLLPGWRQWGLYAACALMVAFLPIHILDLLKERPAIGSKMAATVRLVIQFALVGWLWWLARK
jgi:uncharacterized membrane protein